jgi:hypothetical protein
VKRFLLLCSDPPTPPGASHEGWPAWFSKLGDAFVDVGVGGQLEQDVTRGTCCSSDAATRAAQRFSRLAGAQTAPGLPVGLVSDSGPAHT